MTDEEYYNEKDLNKRCEYVLNTMKRIEFYKENGQWYANVEGHSKEENEMVAGADKFLDSISMGKEYVSMNVSDKICPKCQFLFQRIDHDDYGATYIVVGNHPDAPALGADCFSIPQKKFWLCNVVHTVFGEHPEFISVI